MNQATGLCIFRFPGLHRSGTVAPSRMHLITFGIIGIAAYRQHCRKVVEAREGGCKPQLGR